MRFILTFLFLFAGNSVLYADTLTMKDGSVLKGQVESQEGKSLFFKTSYAGTIKIKWDQVSKLETEQPVKIMLVTDEVIESRYINNIANGISQIKKADEEWKTAFKTDNVAYINPDPWRLGQGFKISGRANFSLKSQHGNTIKDELDMDGIIEFRSQTERFTFSGNLEHDTNKDRTTADNWIFSSKYDYFTTKQRYYGLQLVFERDKFTDLDLRVTFGPHVGHQFYESRAMNLGVDIGMVKVDENNIETKDKDYLAMDWNVNYDQFIWDDIVQLYHKDNGLWDWEKSSKVVINSWTGFRIPLNSGIVASAEVEWEYDSKPKDDVSTTDTTYRVKLGYQW